MNHGQRPGSTSLKCCVPAINCWPRGAIRPSIGFAKSWVPAPKSTIHRYLKEIEEEEGGATGTRVAVNEGDSGPGVPAWPPGSTRKPKSGSPRRRPGTPMQLAAHQQSRWWLQKTEAQATRQQLEQTSGAGRRKKAAHGKTSETKPVRPWKTQLVRNRWPTCRSASRAEERHRQSLEEKHQHARQATGAFPESTKQPSRPGPAQARTAGAVPAGRALRTVNENLGRPQQEAVHTLQENARLLGDLSRARAICTSSGRGLLVFSAISDGTKS